MPEKQNVEWKLKWKDEYLEWICAFANAQGGKIYIGCDDDGNVVGVSNARELMEDIPNKVRGSYGNCRGCKSGWRKTGFHILRSMYLRIR